MTHQRRTRHRFMFSRFNKKDRELFQLMIRSLGGVYLESENFDPSCTHLICGTLVRTEKFLGACATGRWILHGNYIHDSFSKKAWLDEEPYEWNINMCKELTASSGRETLLSIPKQCRIAYSGLSQGPFVNWNVALVCDKAKQPTYKRLLECGGATVACVRLPLSCATSMKKHLTHVLVDEILLSGNKHLLEYVKELRDLGVACVKEVYIGDYLTTFPKPKIEEYLLPTGYTPLGKQNSDRKSQRKKSKSVKRMVDENKRVNDEQWSEKTAKNKVQNKVALTPEKYIKDKSAVKDVVWLTSAKPSTWLQSHNKNKHRGRQKLKQEPSQPTIIHWLNDKMESQQSARNGKKDQVNVPLDNDVIVVKPKYIQTVLSPMKATASKIEDQQKNRICTSILPKAKTGTQSCKRNDEIKDFSKVEFPEQRLHNAFADAHSVTETGKDDVDNPVFDIRQKECGSMSSAHRLQSEVMCEESDTEVSDQLVKPNQDPKSGACFCNVPSTRKLVKHVCNSGAMARLVKQNPSLLSHVPSCLYLPGLISAEDLYKLFCCKVLLSRCDKIQPKPDALHLQQVTAVSPHHNQCIIKEQVCGMSSWLPSCTLNQCHDVIENNADRIDMQVPTQLVHAILDTLMEDNDGWFPYRVLSAIQTMTVSCCCLPANILSQIMRNILWSSKDERQANTAYATLSHILELYPPVTDALQKLHLQSLSDYRMAEHEVNGEWNFIKEVLKAVLKINHHNIQYQYNSFLLLKYVVAMLQKNFNKYCSSHPNHGIPLIAKIIWLTKYREMNSACLDVITFLVNVVKANGMPRKMETLELLQSFMAMVAHCLVFTDPAICYHNLAQLPQPSSLFIRRLVNAINDLQEEAGHLKLILNTISSPWIVFKVTHSLLDLYDRVLLDFADNDKRLKTFQALLNFYTRLIPSNHNEAKYVHSKSSSAMNPTENKMNMVDVSFHQTSKNIMHGNTITQTTNGFHQLFCAEAKSVKLEETRGINKRNCKGETLLHRACIRNNVPRLKKLLLTPGINVNISDFAGWTPLHEACNLGHLECVIELLKYRPQSSATSFYQQEKEKTSKVDIFLTNDHGISVLHDAVMNDHVDVAKILLQCGGDKLLNMKTDAGETALDLACSADMRHLLQKMMCAKDESFVNGLTGPSTGESDIGKKSHYLHVIEEKYKELEKKGRTISSSECERYVILVYHLIVSYMKHYDLAKLASQHNDSNSISSCSHHSQLGGNMISQMGLLDTLHRDIQTLKRLKNFVSDFEKHLKRFCKDLCTEEMYLLSVLHVMGDCYMKG